jgi:phage baseplate assembly protein V
MDVDSRNPFPKTKIGRDHQVRDGFRNGMVIERKFDKERGPLVRVQYMDRQQLISYWLPVKQFGSRKTAHVYTPKIGDHVNVNMLQNGSENGFVDGSFFNKKNPPPDVDIDTRHFMTEDGTIIEYRETDSTFNLDATGAVARTGPRAGGIGGGTVLVTAGLVHIKAPTIILEGFVDHRGDMVTTGTHTDANGIHHGAAKAERDLAAEVDQLKAETVELKAETVGLKERLWALEAKVRKGAGE